MSKRIFMPTKKTKSYTIINICLFVLLFFFLAQTTTSDNDFYLYATVVVTGIGFMWILIFTLILKTKITINQREVYCYGYPWQEGLQIKDDEKVIFKTFHFENIVMIEKTELSYIGSKTAFPAIHFKLKNEADFCAPLDNFSEVVVQEILDALNDEFPFLNG